MAKIAVITLVKEPTQWVSQMVAAKKDGYIHICVDPKYLNKALKGLHYPMTTVEDGASRITSATVFSTLDSINQIRLWVLTTHNFQLPVWKVQFSPNPFGMIFAFGVYHCAMKELFAG